LDPKFAAPAAPTPVNPFGLDDESVENSDTFDCWPDYAIRIRPRKDW